MSSISSFAQNPYYIDLRYQFSLIRLASKTSAANGKFGEDLFYLKLEVKLMTQHTKFVKQAFFFNKLEKQFNVVRLRPISGTINKTSLLVTRIKLHKLKQVCIQLTICVISSFRYFTLT